MTNDQARIFRIALTLELGLGVLGVLVAAMAGVSLEGRMRVEPTVLWQGLAATGPMLVMLAAMTWSRWPPLVRLRRQVDAMIRELFGQSTPLELALVALAAGLGEELLFRGALQSLAEMWLSPLVSLGLVSLLFGLAHALSATYFVLATVVGAYLGWLALATGSLVPPILAHALYDLLALGVLLRRQR